MHGSVFLGASDEVVRPALLWNDQRTHEQCEKITEAVGKERLIELVGSPALTGFQAPKILWLRDEEPKNYQMVAKVLLPKDYVRLLLTGEDATDAAGTLLLDVRWRDWSEEILDALEIPVGWMPKVYEGPESTGVLREDVAGELGLPAGISVAGSERSECCDDSLWPARELTEIIVRALSSHLGLRRVPPPRHKPDR
jgi:xylulokinase